MAQTFDTSRVGGGTYELEQDANGNYKLKSVGFVQVNKLNLPDLATSDTTTTTPKKEEEKKIEVADPFKKLGTQNTGGGEGGGQDYSGVMLKTPEVKEATVRQAGESMTNIASQQTKDIAAGQIKADQAAPQESIGATDSIQPQYQDAILRGQTGVKYQKPISPVSKVTSAVQDTVSGVIDSVKNNKAIQMASNVLGFVTNPLMGAAKMVIGALPEETNIQKMNKSYFNINEGGQRIAGNPATDLYAGMNRNSAFGNLETAGAKRIARREKTAATKNVSDKFKADTERMKEQQKDYKAQKTATQKATQGPAGGATTGGGGGGSDSGRVICTDLHRTGELSTRDWVRDTKFTFKTLSKTHVKGYLLWAEPTVKHMQKYPRYRKIWKHIAQHRANDIAWRLNEGKFDLLGRIYAGIGEPVCWMLGNFVSDKQISKYNLTHWRRA
jgi:hypothetical protein